MGEKSSDSNRSPAIEKPLLEETGYEHLRKEKEKINTIEQELYKKVEEYTEQKVKPHQDIFHEEQKELKQRLFDTYETQQIKPLKEEAKCFEDALESAIDKKGRVSRKITKTKEAIEGLSEFELQRAAEKILRDIRRKRVKDKEA